MKKQKTGFWKMPPLLKAIIVFVVFSLVLTSFLRMSDPTAAFIVSAFYYMAGGVYILGGIYGIWLDRRCYLKFPSVCFVFLVLIIIISIDNFYLFIYPSWKSTGDIAWYYMRSAAFFGGGQILSVAGGLILSKVISYVSQKTSWEIPPLLKAIIVFAVFSLVLTSIYWINNPSATFIVAVFYYMAGGLYILGGVYGIWLDRGCHLKFPSVCFVFLVLIIIISIDNFYLFIYHRWELTGFIHWSFMQRTVFFGGGQILSVAGGFILSKVISYVSKKIKQGG